MKKLLAATLLSSLFLTACDQAKDTAQSASSTQNITEQVVATAETAQTDVSATPSVELPTNAEKSDAATMHQENNAENDKTHAAQATLNGAEEQNEANMVSTKPNETVKKRKKIKRRVVHEESVELEEPVPAIGSQAEFDKHQCRYPFATEQEAREYGCGTQPSIVK